MRYSSLFSNHWQLCGKTWQDARSTEKYILKWFIGLTTVAMAARVVLTSFK